MSIEQPIGILLTNTGSPDAPTPPAVRRFLAEFLSDRRVIRYPRWWWLPLLHGVILRVRPRRSARLYQRLWSERGSPLIHYSRRLAEGVQAALSQALPAGVHASAGMRYGNPSIAAALEELRGKEVRWLVVLPLFPQYSTTTSAAMLDAVEAALKGWQPPKTTVIQEYHDHPAYIQALSAHWLSQPGALEGKLLFSFHGIPQSYARRGDPYEAQCRRSAALLAASLSLPAEGWALAFQSRFGPEAWLQPYTEETLRAWGQARLPRLSVACPGFAADCLETLVEIAEEGRETFLHAGGGEFRYLPALNDSEGHAQALAEIIRGRLD
ncbi:MAG: ferrochelatase [Chloroflexi bacterium]|nr:ferrochelatase [Chloroflexota bacterium]